MGRRRMGVATGSELLVMLLRGGWRCLWMSCRRAAAYLTRWSLASPPLPPVESRRNRSGLPGSASQDVDLVPKRKVGSWMLSDMVRKRRF